MKHLAKTCLALLLLFVPFGAAFAATPIAPWAGTAVRFRFTIDGRIGWFARGRLRVMPKAATGKALIVEFRRRKIAAFSATAPGGAETRLWQGPAALGAGPHTLVLRLVGDTVRLILDHRYLTVLEMSLSGRVRADFEPGHGISARGTPRIQRLGKVLFNDDFARVEKNTGLWEAKSGEFAINAVRNPGTSQDAFLYRGRAPRGRGVALTGMSHWFWADYRVGVSARADRLPSAWGIVFAAVDGETYYAAQWRQPSQAGPGSLALLVHEKGRDTILARTPLSLAARQWDRMEVLTWGTRVAVYANGVRKLTATSRGFTGGRTGLLVEGATTVYFDDFRVHSIAGLPSVNEELTEPFGPNEQPWCDFSKKSFFHDQFMVQWAHPRALWETGTSGTERVFRTRYFHDVRFDWKRTKTSSCHWPSKPMRVELFSSREKPETGYGFRIAANTVELRRNGKRVQRIPLDRKTVDALVCEAAAGAIRCVLNGTTMIEWQDPAPLMEGYVRADIGAVHDISAQSGVGVLRRKDWRDSATVTSHHRLDYNFDFAPTAWKQHSGQWRTTNRWACVPLWSFFAGRGAPGAPGISHENCLLWGRRGFSGDLDMEFFLSPLEGTPQRVHFGFPVTLNIAFAADGEQLDSGYILLFGTHDLPSRLYSRGRLLAETRERLIPLLRREPQRCYCRLTRPWQHIRIQRHGNRVSIWIAGHDDRGNYLGLEKIFDVVDPHPPKGDRIGLWTWGDNGMAVARASVSFEQSRIAVDPGGDALNSRAGSSQTEPCAGPKGRPRSALRVINTQPGGAFRHDLLAGPKRLGEHEAVSFDFRPGKGPLALTLQAAVRGQVAEVPVIGAYAVHDRTINVGPCFAKPPPPGAWSSVAFPLADRLRAVFPHGPLVLDHLVIASPYENIEQIGGQGVNRQGAEYAVTPVRWRMAKNAAADLAPARFRFSVEGIEPLDDFEADTGEWRTLGGWDGAAIHISPKSGPNGTSALCLLNRRIAGPAGAWAVETPYNLSTFPELDFSYRFPPSIEVNLLVKANGQWYEVTATGLDHLWPVVGSIAHFQADGKWHRARVKLYELLRARLGTGAIRVDALGWGDTFRMSSPQDTAWWVDDFCRVPAVSPMGDLRISLEGPDDIPVTAVSFLLDDAPGTVPPAKPLVHGAELHIRYPIKGHWLHVRVQLQDGRWTAVRHLPLVPGTVVAAPKLTAPVVRSASAPPAPFISYIPSDRLCRNEFEWSRTPEFPEQQQGQFAIRRSSWVLLTRNDGATGAGSVDILCVNGSEVYSGYFHKSEWRPARWPKIAFDYKFLQSRTALTLTLLTGGGLGVIEWTGPIGNNAYYEHKRVRAVVIGSIGPAKQDGRWHHVEFDLREMIRRGFRLGDRLPSAVTAREFGTWACGPDPRRRTTFQNPPGARVRIDNFTMYSDAGRSPAFTWAVHDYSGKIKGYAWTWDRKPDTVPREKVCTTEPRAAFRDVVPGTWYLHVRALGANGKWGATAHRRVVIAP